ncbi:MAG: type II secretion system F family protein [Acidimicrobiales bacterium]
MLTGGDPWVLLAALSASVVVGAAVVVMVRPPRRLALRVRPYAQLTRSRLGSGRGDAVVLVAEPARYQSVVDLAAVARRLARALGELLDLGDRSSLESRLRQAGLRDASADQYRMRQLAWTVGGLALGVALGLLLGVSAAGVLLVAGLSGYFGASRWRAKVDRAIQGRRQAMRSELSTVAQLLAVHIRTGHGPVEAVRAISARGLGPVAGELREGLAWINGGLAPGAAYEALAEASAEPLAARLYRLLGSATTSGGDVAPGLLALADDVRSQLRDELARSAIRRRSAMLVPLLALIAPTMLLFIAAALPQVVFGR